MRVGGSIVIVALALACGPRGGECYPIVVYDAVVIGGTNCVLTLSSATATVEIGIGDRSCNDDPGDVSCDGPVGGLFCQRSCDRLFVSATQAAADAMETTLGSNPPVAANVSCDGQIMTTTPSPFAVQGCGL